MQDIKKIYDWNILTPFGYKPFVGIKKQTTDVFFEFEFESGEKLKCTPYHLLKFPTGDFLEACHCCVDDVLEGNKKIVKKEYTCKNIDVYDLMDVEVNEYYTNNIVSHNCAFIEYIDEIWKASQACLSTGGQCIALSTPCVLGDTKIKIRNKNTKEIIEINIEDLKNRDTNDYEVLTPSGWSDFDGIKIKEVDEYLHILFSDNSELKCTIDHKIKCIDDKFKEAIKLKINDKLYNNIFIVDIKHVKEKVNVYDLLNVEKNNEYYTNNVISHNCGTGGWFHHNYIEAESGQGKFHPIKLHWSVHPERDEAYRREQDVLLGVRAAAQEHDCSFETSGDTVIDPEILTFFEQTYVKDPIEKRGIDHGYWIWEYPDYNKQYVVAVDVSRGDGTDYSAFQIIEVSTMTQVAEYQGKMDTRAFGRFVVNAAIEYNNALLVIENANLGWDVVQTAIEQNYQNLYYSFKDADMVDVQTYINKGYDLKYKEDKVPGFTTSIKSRPLMISKMQLYCEQKLVVIQSKRLLEQLRVFVWKNGKPQAQHGYNDDNVLAYAIGLWVRDAAVRLATQGNELTKKTIGLIQTSLNYYNTPAKSLNRSNYMNQRVVNPYTNASKKQADADLDWLFNHI